MGWLGRQVFSQPHLVIQTIDCNATWRAKANYALVYYQLCEINFNYHFQQSFITTNIFQKRIGGNIASFWKILCTHFILYIYMYVLG